ncbi:MAG: CCA tRNA nucleotidyltransferase [Planktotalea sp.]|uniref:CCA tRNA nucleotidyltransferase n=1 Tax=Planktotalea sp. TaxID=2029877 RepID=UPI003C734B42
MIVRGAWIETPATQAVCTALSKNGHQVFFVGGCVRNALLGVAVSDIDIATDALPEETMRCAKEAGLNAIPTGIEHGTVTVVSGGIAHEITTFRSDVETDGRHADVAFSKSIEEDAARRDFTMNALYAGADGTIHDPLGGLQDLNDRHVRFIGDANQRIHEDYLRSLRFFRFTAHYGNPALGIDADGLAAVAENLDGLARLSRERVGAELLKLMSAQNPSMAVAAMRSSGVLAVVLEGGDDRALAPLIHLEQSLGISPDPIRRLAVIAGAPDKDALRLSRADHKRWAMMRDEVESMKTASHLGYLHGAAFAIDVLLLRAALFEQPVVASAIAESNKGDIAEFPIKAKDLPGFSGPALGEKLRALEAKWIASSFTLTREELLA